jgi:TonB family protein
MSASRSALDNIKVAAPCTAEWRFMLGNDLVRFCGQCNKNVYNLSAMTREQAETLIRRMEGRLCVRYYRRSDGTILNADCPVGLRAVRQRVRRITTAVFAVLISFFANIGLLSLLGKGRSVISPVMGGIAVPYVGSGESVCPPVVGQVAVSDPPVMGRVAFSPKTVYRSESFLRSNAIMHVEQIFTYNGSGVGARNAVVRLTISQTGEVINARYVSGPPDLEIIATETAKQWKFKPAKVDGLPVQVEGPLTFRVTNPYL